MGSAWAAAMIMPIDRTLLDGRLLGASLGPVATWLTWFVVLKAAFALSLTDDERKLFAAVAGDRRPPRSRTRELWCLVGRRGGKSRIAALVATYIALFTKPRLAPGETGVVLVLAASAEQAQVVFGYAKAALTSSPVLRREIDSVTRTEIRLKNGTTICVVANSYRTTRGRTVIAAIFDECSFWRSEDSASPDDETYSAILPSLATVNGMLISISSAYRRAGLMYTKHRDFFGVDSDDTLVVSGGSTTFNPTLDTAVIEAQRKADPTAAASEWDSEFRSDLSTFLDDATIERSVAYGRPIELSPLASLFYRGFCDPSGGRHDSYTLAIAHKEGEHYVVDLVRGTKGSFDPEEVTKGYAKLCREYRIYSVTGDNYAAEWVSAAWSRTGIDFVRAEKPKSQLYLEALPLFARGLVELPDHPRLTRELRLLERRTHRSGRDTVDHGPRGSDDHANAVVGALRCLCDHFGGDDLTMWRRAWDPDYEHVDPGIERARIAERRFREEVLAKICQPPQPPRDLLTQIERLKAQRRNACCDD
jgi:hypothetical protein